MSVLIVIPARYASSRFPGKPLVSLTGATGVKKPLIQRTWEAALAVSGVDRVVIATDDDRIRAGSEAFGADVVMTSETARNGTERCAEALGKFSSGTEIIVNLQGDSPLTPPWFIEDLISGLRAAPDAHLATPVLRCDGRMLGELLEDRRAGRVGGTTAVFGSDNQALYFSKEVIPFTSERYDAADPTPVYHHIGVYAYRPSVLVAYPDWPIGPLERLEGLEQLRFLEHGKRVLCVPVDGKGRSFWELNNPEDTARIETILAELDIA